MGGDDLSSHSDERDAKQPSWTVPCVAVKLTMYACYAQNSSSVRGLLVCRRVNGPKKQQFQGGPGPLHGRLKTSEPTK